MSEVFKALITAKLIKELNRRPTAKEVQKEIKKTNEKEFFDNLDKEIDRAKENSLTRR